MSNFLEEDIEKVLFSHEQLEKRIKEMGEKISRDYEGKYPLLIAILRGAIMFIADLSRAITIPINLDFMVCTRYGSKDQPGRVRILKDLELSAQGRHLLIVEDVIDNGDTLFYLSNTLKLRKPASLKICTLFDKPYRRRAPIQADYSGFIIPDRFVVGFGLDYKEKYRNLPFLGTLKPGLCRAPGETAEEQK
ncbi:MAG: hypoxanthine phosphoribosyltransferase [Chloroflexi bacterium]|nr:hypoxanthine phosphoribosyltransferase [Chloroflexota bacterium]